MLCGSGIRKRLSGRRAARRLLAMLATVPPWFRRHARPTETIFFGGGGRGHRVSYPNRSVPVSGPAFAAHWPDTDRRCADAMRRYVICATCCRRAVRKRTFTQIRIRVYMPLCTGETLLADSFLRERGVWPPSQILSLRVYNMPTVSPISRPRLLVVHSVYRLYSGKRVCAQCLQTMHSVHRLYVYANAYTRKHRVYVYAYTCTCVYARIRTYLRRRVCACTVGRLTHTTAPLSQRRLKYSRRAGDDWLRAANGPVTATAVEYRSPVAVAAPRVAVPEGLRRPQAQHAVNGYNVVLSTAPSVPHLFGGSGLVSPAGGRPLRRVPPPPPPRSPVQAPSAHSAARRLVDVCTGDVRSGGRPSSNGRLATPTAQP